MNRTEQLREYLDAHGIDGAPTEPGWYVVRTVATVVVVVTAAATGRLVYAAGRLVYAIGCEHSGRYLFASDIVRHAPLTLAAPAGRDIDAEVVARVQVARDAVATPQPPPVAIGQPVTPALVEWLTGRGRDVGRIVPVVEARDAFGRKKYGQPLYSHDGRDVSADFGQELADALQYGMAARMRGVPLDAWAPMLLALADLISGDATERDDLRGPAGKVET